MKTVNPRKFTYNHVNPVNTHKFRNWAINGTPLPFSSVLCPPPPHTLSSIAVFFSWPPPNKITNKSQHRNPRIRLFSKTNQSKNCVEINLILKYTHKINYILRSNRDIELIYTKKRVKIKLWLKLT